MREQFGTITVREAYLTRAEVERIIAENMKLRGPSSYEFDYLHPVMIWGKDGDLTVRWPSRAMREEPGRRHSELQLLPWPEFIRRESVKVENKREAAAATKA